MNQGYIAIISVLIISGIATLIVGSVILFSIGEANMGLYEEQSWYSFYLAHACAEQALLNLKSDLGYTGDETIGDFENGRCEIKEVEGSGNQNRVIKTKGQVFNKTRRLRIEINQVNPQFNIKLWQEVNSF